MKRLCLILALAIACPLAPIGCNSSPSSRVQQVQTLKGVGASVDTAMKVAARLLKDGKITREQWDKLAAFHDNKFQPAYKFAVSLVRSDLSSVASPDILSLLSELLAIVDSF